MAERTRTIRRYLIFDSMAEARAFSRQIMRARQSEETRNDPKTVTKHAYSWHVNRATGRCGLLVPNDRSERRFLTRAYRDLLKREIDAVNDGDIEVHARRVLDDRYADPETNEGPDPVPPGESGSGGGRRG